MQRLIRIALSILVATLVVLPALLLSSVLGMAQSTPNTPTESQSVPRLIRFGGNLKDTGPHNGPVGMTFAIYKDQEGGAPLWIETQNVRISASGAYVVLLGTEHPEGVPIDLFTSGEACWLGVTVEGQQEFPRVRLVSVPYALKAADADRVGGLAAEELVSRSELQSQLQQHAAEMQAAPPTSTTFRAQGTTSLAAPQSGQTTFTANTANFVVSVAQSGAGAGLLAYSGAAPASFATATGIQAQGPNGIAATATTSGGIGVSGIATSGTGIVGQGGNVGVLGSASANGGTGVAGTDNSTNGTGVSGTSSAGNGTGVSGQSPGTGVQGTGTASNGSSSGVVGLSRSSSGIGVLAQDSATSGNTTGLKAVVSSATGTSAVFNNTAGGKSLSVQNAGVETASITATGNIATSGPISSSSISTGIVSATGNVSAPSATISGALSAGSISGNGAGLTNLTGANVTGTVANAANAQHATTADSATTAGSATTAASANDAFNLGGVAATNFARLDIANTFLANNHFNGALGIDGDLTLAGNVNGQGSRSLSGFNTVSGYVGAFDRIALGTGPVGSEQAVMVGNSSQGVFNIHTANTGTSIGAGWYAGWALTQAQHAGQGAFFTLGTDNSGSAYYFHPHSLTISTSDPNQGQIIFNTGARDSNALVIDRSGFVGIGTGAPTQALDVAGNVRANSFIGDGSGLTNIAAGTALNAQHATTADSATVAGSATTAASANDAFNLGGVAATNYARLDQPNTFAASQIIYGHVGVNGNVDVTQDLGVVRTLNVGGFGPRGQISSSNNTDQVAGYFENATDLGGNDTVYAKNTGFGTTIHALSTNRSRAGFFELNNPGGTVALEAAAVGSGVALKASNSGGGPAAFFDQGNVGIGTATPQEKLDVAGNVNASGNVRAASFIGDGSGLTNLPATNLSSLNASNLTSGTVPLARMAGAYNIDISGNAGSATSAANAATAQNAAQLNGLPASAFAQQSAPNTFIADQTVQGNVNIHGAGNGVVFPDGTKQTTAAGAVSSGIPSGFLILGNSPTAPAGFTPSGFMAAGNLWTSAPPMPSPGWALAAVTVNGRLYTIGGGDRSQTVEAFDPAANTWSTAQPMPTGRDSLAAVSLNGKIYAIGGGYNGGSVPTVQVYDPVANSWSTAPPMPTNRYGLAAVALNGKIYTMGGFDGNHGYFNTVEVFDPVGNSWSTVQPMPTARDFLAAVVVNGSIYAIGGSNGVFLSTVEVYDPVADSWSTAQPMPTQRFGLASVAVNGKIYAIGGYGGGPVLATVEVYDSVGGGWSTAPSMPTARYWVAADVVNGHPFVVGGLDGNNSRSAAAEQYQPPTTLYMFTKN